MAKKGTFSFSTDQGDVVYLAAASFSNPKFEVYANAAGGTPHDSYRLSWFNLGSFADSGSVQGVGLPMTIGQAGYTGAAFTFGATYVFSLSIYSVNTKGLGIAKWRKLKSKLSRKFEPVIVAPSGGDQPPAPDKVEWLIPILHEMMI